jgi:hypothetical protein
MNKESLVKEQKNFSEIGEEISHELAGKFIKNHHDQYSYENSFSYVIGKNIMDKIMAQPGCAGIRIVEAVNEFGNKTLVYVGIDEKGNNILEYTSVNQHGDIAVTEGMIGDRSAGGTTWIS